MMLRMALSNPSKPIPKFKLTQNGGKFRELARGMRGPLVKKYYQGWCEFVKITNGMEATLLLLPGVEDVSIHLNYRDNKVIRVTAGEPIGLTDVVAVSAGPRDTMTFKVSSMVSSMFVQKANTEGAVVTFN